MPSREIATRSRLPGRRSRAVFSRRKNIALYSNPTREAAKAACFSPSERVGFEPMKRFHVYTLSKRAP